MSSTKAFSGNLMQVDELVTATPRPAPSAHARHRFGSLSPRSSLAVLPTIARPDRGPDDIISEYPGDFIGIRSGDGLHDFAARLSFYSHPLGNASGYSLIRLPYLRKGETANDWRKHGQGGFYRGAT
jgi:hypothetical protein